MSIGHRIRSPHDLTFTSEGVVDAYLNPDAQPGCAVHGDSDCLCDIKIDTPTEVTDIPASMAGIETPEQLVQYAANLWATLDLMGTMRDRSSGAAKRREHADKQGPGIGFVNAVTDAQIREAAALVREGTTRKQLQEKFPQAHVSNDVYHLLRKVAGSKGAEREPLPVQRIVELGDAGYTLKQVWDILAEEYGRRWDRSNISRVYREQTGRKIKPHVGRVAIDSAA